MARVAVAPPVGSAAPAPGADVVVTRPSIRNLSLAGLVVLGAGALAIMVWRLGDTLLLILAAVILGEGLRPAIQSLQRRGLPFGIATGLIYLALTVAIVLLLIAMARPLVSQSTQLAQTLPSYQRQIQGNVTLVLARLHVDSAQLSSLTGMLVSSLGSVSKEALGLGGALVKAMFDMVTIVLLSVFWLTARRDLRPWLMSLFSDRHQAKAGDVIDDVAGTFAGYVRGVAANMIAIGILAFAVCWALRLPAPLLLGVAAGLAELIPLVGPFLGAVPAVLLGFTIGPFYPLLVAACFLVIQQLESNLFTPLVMRRAVGVRPFVLLGALLVGSALAGLLGALVAVPVAAAIQIVILDVALPAVLNSRPRAAAEVVGTAERASPRLEEAGA
jgi:predicted PurR-regulated permease PerM